MVPGNDCLCGENTNSFWDMTPYSCAQKCGENEMCKSFAYFPLVNKGLCHTFTVPCASDCKGPDNTDSYRGYPVYSYNMKFSKTPDGSVEAPPAHLYPWSLPPAAPWTMLADGLMYDAPRVFKFHGQSGGDCICGHNTSYTINLPENDGVTLSVYDSSEADCGQQCLEHDNCQSFMVLSNKKKPNYRMCHMFTVPCTKKCDGPGNKPTIYPANSYNLNLPREPYEWTADQHVPWTDGTGNCDCGGYVGEPSGKITTLECGRMCVKKEGCKAFGVLNETNMGSCFLYNDTCTEACDGPFNRRTPVDYGDVTFNMNPATSSPTSSPTASIFALANTLIEQELRGSKP